MTAIKMGLTIEEAAECTGIGRNTMRKLVDWGKLPVLKVGRKTIIRRDTLERFMTVNQGRNLLNPKAWQDIRSFRCRSCPMSREESHISRATPNRKTFMPPIVPPTIPFGTISPGKASRSSYEAEQQERVLKQGS